MLNEIKKRVSGFQEVGKILKNPADLLKIYIPVAVGYFASDYSPFGCGKTDKGILVHDHEEVLQAVIDPAGNVTETYDKNKHGALTRWTKVGQRVKYIPNSKDGKVPTHYHDAPIDGSFGHEEYRHVEAH